MERIVNEMMSQNLFDRGQSMGHTEHIGDIDSMNHAQVARMPDYMTLGICYVPMQNWEKLYDEDTAFSVGTIFPALDKPFLGVLGGGK